MKIFPYSMLDGYLVLPNAIPTETKTHICAEIQQKKGKLSQNLVLEPICY